MGRTSRLSTYRSTPPQGPGRKCAIYLSRVSEIIVPGKSNDKHLLEKWLHLRRLGTRVSWHELSIEQLKMAASSFISSHIMRFSGKKFKLVMKISCTSLIVRTRCNEYRSKMRFNRVMKFISHWNKQKKSYHKSRQYINQYLERIKYQL